MIKWLSASRLKNATQCEPTPLTNDPLAVITGVNNLDGKCQIYAVTRVNPLFTEERTNHESKEDSATTPDDNSDENGDQRLSPRKSISSGYESRCNSSSESSSCTECESHAIKKSVSPQKREKRWTRQAKKRNSDYDSSSDASALSSGQDYAARVAGESSLPATTTTAASSALPLPAKRRSKKYKSGSPPGSSNLSPIPEGKIDCSIPPPIWPRFGSDADETAPTPETRVPAGMPFHDGTTNPLNFMYKYNEKYPKCCNGSSRSMWNYFDEKGHLSGAVSVKTEYEHNWIECCRDQCSESFSSSKSLDDSGKGSTTPTEDTLERAVREKNKLTRDVLRDLANLVSYAMKRKNVLSVEEILLTLSESIQKSLEVLGRAEDGEGSPARMCDVKSDLAKVSDEIYSSGSEGKESTSSSSGCKEYSSSSNSSNAGKDNVYGTVAMYHDREVVYGSAGVVEIQGSVEKEKCRSSDSDTSLIHHQRESSSSSTESGFGFSDSSPTPTSSSDTSSNERSRGVLDPVFLYESVYGFPKGVRGSLPRDPVIPGRTDAADATSRECGSSAFVKLISAKRKISGEEMNPLTLMESGKSLLPCRSSSPAASIKVDKSVLKKIEHPYYIAVGRPDFTLDLPQAEKLMKKLSSSKRRRCWCRLTTSLLGLVFFLFSVMMVSLIVTKGKRLFGAL